MASYPFQFKSTKGKAPATFSFHVHGEATESDARAALIAQLQDVFEQAQSLKTSDAPQGAPGTTTTAPAADDKKAEKVAKARARRAAAKAAKTAPSAKSKGRK